MWRWPTKIHTASKVSRTPFQIFSKIRTPTNRKRLIHDLPTPLFFGSKWHVVFSPENFTESWTEKKYGQRHTQHMRENLRDSFVPRISGAKVLIFPKLCLMNLYIRYVCTLAKINIIVWYNNLSNLQNTVEPNKLFFILTYVTAVNF